MADKIEAGARLVQGNQLALDNARAHCVVSDLPTDTGEGYGPTPLELCIMSHAGCYAITLVSTAKKMRINLAALEVRVTATKGNEAGTITEEKFDIKIKTDATPDRIQRLHELTLEHCPVGIIFEKANVKIAYNIETT